MLCRSLLLLAALTALTAVAQADDWRLLSREEGCVPLAPLVRRLDLPTTPRSPDDFAAMMRARGKTVTTALPAGFPLQWRDAVVQVTVRDNLAPVFVRQELCPQLQP